MKKPRRWTVWAAAGLIGLALSGCAINFTPQPIPQPFPQNAPLPVSRFELDYEPDLWNDAGIVQNSTNCYAYALDRRAGFPEGHKLQPGELSGTPLATLADVDVERIKELTHTYSKPGIYIVTLTVKDAAGNTVSDSLTITVEESPENKVAALPTWFLALTVFIDVIAVTSIVRILLMRIKRKKK